MIFHFSNLKYFLEVKFYFPLKEILITFQDCSSSAVKFTSQLRDIKNRYLRREYLEENMIHVTGKIQIEQL